MNLSQIPPGGWQFHSPATGWSIPHPVGVTHDQAVTLIIKHRMANPAITAKHKLSTDFGSVSNELIKFQQARGSLPPDAVPKLVPPSLMPQMSEAVRDAVAVVKKMASGMASLLEWDEAGMPHVEPAVAEQRAATCSKCPKNDRTKSLRERFTDAVADKYNARFRRMDELNLRTSHDDELKVCQACLCPMRTKVFFPPELVLKRLKTEQRMELNQVNPRCWILDL